MVLDALKARYIRDKYSNNDEAYQSALDSTRDGFELLPAAAEAKEAGAIVVVWWWKVLWGGLRLSRLEFEM